MSAPKHRANKIVRTEPRMQPAGRHVADRLFERLGAQVFDLEEFKWLLHDIGPGNPFKGRAL